MNFQGILDGIKNTIGGLFPPKLISPVPDSELVENWSPERWQKHHNDNFDAQMAAKGMYRHPDNVYREGRPGGVTPTPSPIAKTVSNVLGARNTNLPEITEDQIRKGWDAYGDGNAPAATQSATFARVANQYPILRQHPGLLPAMAMKETSGGKASQNKNWFNWGIYDDSYQEKDPAKVIEAVARAIGSDDSPSSHYYQKFRETGNIRDMLDRYAPPTENDTGLYHKQLLDWMKMFE